jgi:tRNA modification GTPase
MKTMNDGIFAQATVAGTSAIAVIRISGRNVTSVVEKIFIPSRKDSDILQRGIYYGSIVHEGHLVDKVMLSIFRAPSSYTGEDMAEISFHGSVFLQQRMAEVLLDCGLRQAKAGEFTLRAFLNGKFDLSQAEAVADLISATSGGAHALAMSQLRGGFSKKIAGLREKLLEFAALMELELDFGEEDVEFADRDRLSSLLQTISEEAEGLITSFQYGNVIKRGIPVAIAGRPNVGKSTLLNALLNEERAIVSEIPGTTRDTVEDLLTVGGLTFRFIDTAGLHHSTDMIENLGMERSLKSIEQALVVLYVVDISTTTTEEIRAELAEMSEFPGLPERRFIVVANKTDLLVEAPHHFRELVDMDTLFISAKRNENISMITDALLKICSSSVKNEVVVSNIRHLEALQNVLEAVKNIKAGLESKQPTVLLTSDIRTALHYLGEITGEVSTEEILGAIFSRFCIGK